MLNNCVIVKVIANYDYICNVIDYNYDYIASGNGDYDYDYDYLISCNRLRLPITITPTLYRLHHSPAPSFQYEL